MRAILYINSSYFVRLHSSFLTCFVLSIKVLIRFMATTGCTSILQRRYNIQSKLTISSVIQVQATAIEMRANVNVTIVNKGKLFFLRSSSRILLTFAVLSFLSSSSLLIIPDIKTEIILGFQRSR